MASRTVIDASAGGSIIELTLTQAFEGPIRRPEGGGSEWEPIKILLQR
jgi:hypothetical protein